MKHLMVAVTTTMLITGCAQVPPTAVPDTAKDPVGHAEHELKELNVSEVQDQLSRFVEIIELIEQTSAPADANPAPDRRNSQQLTTLISAFSENLENLNDSHNETQTLREILNLGDQFSSVDNKLFSSLLGVITRDIDK